MFVEAALSRLAAPDRVLPQVMRIKELVKRGIGAFGRPSYSLEETRESLKDTTTWVAHPRAD